MSITIKIIILVAIIILILFSAFFSSCEIAYSSVSRIKLKKKAEDGSKAAVAALKIIDDYSNTLSTILVGNNLVNTLISSLGTLVAVAMWGEELGPVYSVLILTIVVLIFGEILPKTIGNKFNLSLALLYPKLFSFFKVLFFPITWVASKILTRISEKSKPKESEPTATDEELISITEELEEEGVIDEDDAELIKSAIDFCDVTAHEIMIPRVDVFAIDIEDSKEEILNDEHIFRYSRVPVFEDTIDNIVGILNTTDLMKMILNNQTVDLRSMLKEPLYVHKTKAISTILTELKETHTHLAIVVDEFGGMMGILTMEDIIEELVGDIFDETDEVVLDYREINKYTYEVDGDMNIYDFFELVNYEDKDFESEYTTIGGWCTDILERFPQIGDTFEFSNMTITIIDADKMRVGKVLVEIHEPIIEE